MRKVFVSSFSISSLLQFAFFLFSHALFSQSDQNRSVIVLDPHQFQIQMNLFENEVLIDVRTYEEFQKERLHKAILASNSKELFSITDTLDLEQPLFIYCDEESRSITACKFLIERGFIHVYFLKDGISGWKKRDLEVDDSRLCILYFTG